MKKIWISKKDSAELILFFNGWGMDERPFGHLAVPDGFDILMTYDYTKLESLADDIKGYSRIHLVAWSLGVYAAAEIMQDIEFASATAINGTLKPIDAAEGIAPAVFQGTIDSWSEVAALKFNRRMCGKYNKEFKASAPERSTDDQKNELVALSKRIQNKPIPDNIFRQAVIGVGDRIFLREAQEKHWHDARIHLRIVDEPHYFFPALKNWKEMLFE